MKRSIVSDLLAGILAAAIAVVTLALSGCGGGGGQSATLSLSPDALAPAVFGERYETQIRAENATAPVEWQIIAGELPPGITPCTAGTTTCTLSGVPAAWSASPFSVSLRAVDAARRQAERTYTILVAPAGGPLALGPAELPRAAKGAPYEAMLQATGGHPAYGWSLAAGDLPPGVSLCPGETGAACRLSGRPAASGTFSFRVLVSDANAPAQTAARDLLLEVGATQRTLTVTLQGNGTVVSGESPRRVECGPTCRAAYDEGSLVRLTALPGPGEDFTAWSGDCTGTAAAVEVTLDADKTCAAAFTARYLPGASGDLASARLPELSIPSADLADFTLDDRPGGTGLWTSRTRILLRLSEAATVAQVNTLFASAGATLAGALPEAGIVLVTLPDRGDLGAIEAAVSALGGDPAIGVAARDVVLGTTIVGPTGTAVDENPGDFCPDCGYADTANAWRWSEPPSLISDPGSSDGSWGMQAMRVPQLWNLNDFASRQANSPVTGVFDIGFNDSRLRGPTRELQNLTLLWPQRHAHGELVAGIMGARFYDGVGIQGVNPFAERHDPPDGHFLGVSTRPVESDRTEIGFAFSTMLGDLRDLLTRAAPRPRVLNVSVGYNFGVRGLDPEQVPAAQTLAAAEGLLVRAIAERAPETLFVVSAGNDSIGARWASPFTFAALGPTVMGGGRSFPPSENILVVEAVEPRVEDDTAAILQRRYMAWPRSNLGGHVSAPGARVLSVAGANLTDGAGPSARPFRDYETFSGTSFAAPHVAGLAGFLLTLDERLTVADLRRLITDPSRTRATAVSANRSLPPGVSGPARLVDAFAAAIGIDPLRGNKTIQEALVDVDDGTADGNQRTERGVDGQVRFDDGSIWTLDKRRGDGRINMADFRAFRDAVTAAEAARGGLTGTASLDGSPRHFKRDSNQDGCVAGAPADPPHPSAVVPAPTGPCGTLAERSYSRYDFNGDGIVSAIIAAPFNGNSWTDLDVLKDVWSADPERNEGWSADDLATLVPPVGGSGDLWIVTAMELGASQPIDEIRVTLDHNGRAVTRSLRSFGAPLIWTVRTGGPVAVVAKGYKANAYVADLCVWPSSPLSALSHGEDRPVQVFDCSQLPYLERRVVYEAASGYSPTQGVYRYYEREDIREDRVGLDPITTCPPLAVGGTCTISWPLSSPYSSSDYRMTLRRTAGREWLVEATLTATATHAPFLSKCGTGTCQSLTRRRVWVTGVLPIPVGPPRRIAVECAASGDYFDDGGGFLSYGSLATWDEADVYANRFHNCTQETDFVSPGWSLDAMDAHDRSTPGPAYVRFKLYAAAEAFRSRDATGAIVRDLAHSAGVRLSRLRITVTDLP